MKIGSYFSVDDLKSPYILTEGKPYGVDLTTTLWKELVRRGYPLIKRKVINGYYGHLKDWSESKIYLPIELPERKIKKILFVNHSESRTGAPKVVFEVAKEMKKYFEVKMVNLENLME